MMHPLEVIIVIIGCTFAGVLSEEMEIRQEGGGTEIRIDYFLFRRSNSKGIRLINDKFPSDFDRQLPMFVLFHGVGGNPRAYCQKTVRKALLDRGNFNVLVPTFTNSSVLYTVLYQEVARRVGNFLLKEQFSPSTTTIIGLSLGSHIAGLMGRRSGFRAHRIYALDPAGPVFDTLPDAQRLNAQSADYVQVFHTNVGILGAISPLGHDDIYVNGGNSYPCCVTDLCRHIGSCDTFVRTIRKGLIQARLCANVQEARLSACKGQLIKVGFGSPARSGQRISHASISGCLPQNRKYLKYIDNNYKNDTQAAIGKENMQENLWSQV